MEHGSNGSNGLKRRHPGILLFWSLLLTSLLLTAYSSVFAQTQNVDLLKSMIKTGYDNAYTGNEIINQIESRLIPIRLKIESLNDQVNLLDEEYKLTRKKIQDLEKQIAIKKKEIDILGKESQKFNSEIDDNKKILLDLGALMYENQRKYIDFDKEEKSINIIKLLLSSSIISDIPKNNDYLKIAGELGKDVLSNTQKLADKQDISLNLLEEKSEKLKKLEKKLDLQKKIIVTQKEAKKALISFTKGSEKAYQSLLNTSRKEQESILSEIKGYQKKIREINALLGADSSDSAAVLSQGIFAWPVDPGNGISAYFHDNEYEDRFGIVHNAIDIKVQEGTQIEAPADGYIYKIHDGGMGYSYLILAHRNNTLTVYGHLLEFNVEEGDIVDKGDIIGLTGGRPGTPGAGYLTTGPHLHFEVYDNGKHIDPLSVLNLNKIPDKYLPNKYL